jgi:hypothetical protein
MLFVFRTSSKTSVYLDGEAYTKKSFFFYDLAFLD